MTDTPLPGRCNAKNRAGGYCAQWPCAGRKRCKFHGGAPGSGIHKSGKKPVLTEAALEGKRRADERRRQAIAEGVLDKFPQGRKKGSRNKTAAPDMNPLAPDMPATAVASTTRRGAELGKAVDKGLAFINRELDDDSPIDDVGAYRRKLVNTQVAKAAINAQIRVDENELRAQKATRLGSLLSRLRNAKDLPEE